MILWVIDNLNAFIGSKDFSSLNNIDWLLAFDGHGNAMSDGDRDPDAGRGDLDVIAMEDLSSLVDHLHLLFGVAIISEDVDLRDAGGGDVIWIEFRLLAFSAAFQIV